MNNHTPTDGFGFPPDQRDLIDQQLRKFVAQDQPLQSVRPERRPGGQPPIVVPDEPRAKRSVPVVEAPTTPMADPEGISIPLPSRFHYYSFKDLYVKPFRVFHLAKLSKANETGSLQTLAEAVSSVLSSSTSASKNLAFDLTMSDFNSVLYWLRLNSFSKKQMRVTSMCSNPVHQHRVSSGELPEASLNVTTIYTNSDIKYTELEEAPDPEYYKVEHKGQSIRLRPETLSQIIQFLDSPNWDDEEFGYKARIAAVLDLPGHLNDKIKIVDKLDPDQAVIALEFADKVDTYGVQETVTTKCMECGASGTVKIVVDAPCFLSPEF